MWKSLYSAVYSAALVSAFFMGAVEQKRENTPLAMQKYTKYIRNRMQRKQCFSLETNADDDDRALPAYDPGKPHEAQEEGVTHNHVIYIPNRYFHLFVQLYPNNEIDCHTVK